MMLGFLPDDFEKFGFGSTEHVSLKIFFKSLKCSLDEENDQTELQEMLLLIKLN